MTSKKLSLMRALSWCALFALFASVAPQPAMAQGKGSTPLLWEVRSQTNVVYVLGTIHIGRDDMYPLGEAVEKAYRASRAVALELDPFDRPGTAKLLSALSYPPHDDLAKRLSPTLFARLARHVERIGVPMQAVKSLRPFMAASLITVVEFARAGFNPALGVDNHFAHRARQDGKRLVPLESYESQAAMINSLSPGLQERFMEETLQLVESQESAALIQTMMKAWRSGDVENVEALLKTVQAGLPASLHEEFIAKVLRDRNVVMARKIDAMLKGSEPHFVAVGTLHLVGRDSVFEFLPGRPLIRRL